MMRSILRTLRATLAVAVVTVLAQAAAHAHFIWATVEGGQVRFALLEDANEAPDAKFEKYVESLSPLCGGKVLTLGAAKAGARSAPVPAGQNVVTAETIVRAKEAREGEAGGNYLLVYHAKGAATLAAAATATNGPAEVRAVREGNKLVVSVYQDEWPVPNAEVWVHWPGMGASSVTTDLKGEASVVWPEKLSGGFVGVRAMVNETKSGEHGGIKYTSIHRWATLTFPVAGPRAEAVKAAAAEPAGEKPLTRILRESYGVNHEVVGNAAFNKTLFAGKLTKAQVEAHLQQRALIHNEVHRILNAAGTKVPYGADQKHVLVYLFDDLIAMGSGWPTEPQARPLTKAFLQEIRDSEKRGPYFALGVQHVYYGGITNGGRMIGQKITDTIGVTLTYYGKSDGYQPYLAEVNKIMDPAAREEMIRGGKAAYQYIIASSNEDIFKADYVAGGAAK
jgi:hypothetical protein